jgi:protein TonB
MFDKLVESTEERASRRAGRYLLVTGTVYLMALIACLLLAISRYSPVLAESMGMMSSLAPIPLLANQPASPVRRAPNADPSHTQRPIFAPPREVREIPTAVPGPLTLPVDKLPLIGQVGPPGGIPRMGGPEEGAGPPVPPPTPRPAPKIDPPPTPEAIQGPKKVSEGVLQGKAIRKPVPPYPMIAKRAGVSGLVQVMVTISEEGRVIEATVINGHPLLREAAVTSARQWHFSPTFLSQVPVKVQGVLSFNFTLQ